MNQAEKIVIKLLPEHRGPKSSAFTGRPQGEQVRKRLGLDAFDSDNLFYQVNIPENSTSFNASFYLGLFFESIKNLGGLEEFKKKYELFLLETNPTIRKGLLEDIQDCERQASNEFYGETGLDI